jgi:hypothetical protein
VVQVQMRVWVRVRIRVRARVGGCAACAWARVVPQNLELSRVVNLLLAHAHALTDLRTGAVIRAGCSNLFVRRCRAHRVRRYDDAGVRRVWRAMRRSATRADVFMGEQSPEGVHEKRVDEVDMSVGDEVAIAVPQNDHALCFRPPPQTDPLRCTG